jgi:hypothetical protein
MFWYTILLAITCLLMIVVPGDPASLRSLHINEQVYRLLVVTILLPYAIIWFSAFYGYDQVAKYSRSLVSTIEGKAFNKVSVGLGVIAWGLVLQVTLSLIFNAITVADPSFETARAVINGYMSLVIAMVGFIYIENGTYELAHIVRARNSRTIFRLLIVFGAVLGALFQRIVFMNQSAGGSPYHLPAWPLIFTIIIPYIFTWVIAAVSVYELNVYAAKVKGLLYKQALQFLANGLSVVIILSVTIQFINAGSTPRSNTSLGTLLLLEYLLLAAIALGFVLIATGAKRLKRIEEV